MLVVVLVLYFQQDFLFKKIDKLILQKNPTSSRPEKEDLETPAVESDPKSEVIDYEEFLKRVPFRKPEAPFYKKWLHQGAISVKGKSNV
jgi:hypothetical protein